MLRGLPPLQGANDLLGPDRLPSAALEGTYVAAFGSQQLDGHNVTITRNRLSSVDLTSQGRRAIVRVIAPVRELPNGCNSETWTFRATSGGSTYSYEVPATLPMVEVGLREGAVGS